MPKGSEDLEFQKKRCKTLLKNWGAHPKQNLEQLLEKYPWLFNKGHQLAIEQLLSIDKRYFIAHSKILKSVLHFSKNNQKSALFQTTFKEQRLSLCLSMLDKFNPAQIVLCSKLHQLAIELDELENLPEWFQSTAQADNLILLMQLPPRNGSAQFDLNSALLAIHGLDEDGLRLLGCVSEQKLASHQPVMR